MHVHLDADDMAALMATAHTTQPGTESALPQWHDFKVQGALPQGLDYLEFVTAAAHAGRGARFQCPVVSLS